MNKKLIIIVSLVVIFFLIMQFWPEPSIDWNDNVGYRWAEIPTLEPGKPGFTLLPASKTGITFSNSLTHDQIGDNRFLLGGSGVATGDINGDGLVDVYFCKLDGSNVLYENLGNWKFKDITQQAGVACPNRFSTGATFADLDGDYDLDLLVNALGGPNACFINDGTGKFTEVTESVGLNSNTGSTSMALADIDGDGDLDLYVTNFKKKSVENIYPARERAPNRVTKKIGKIFEVVPEFEEHYRIEIIGNQPALVENAEPDILYVNDGKGHFKRVSFTEGRFLDEQGKPVSELKDWGLLVRFQDMDNDGDPDIYVCNDYSSPDRIWINDGTGHFRAIDKLAIRHTSKFTMAVDFSDIDRDGDVDFFLIDMLAKDHQRRIQQMGMDPNKLQFTEIGKFDNRPQIKQNTLFLNRGDLTYAEIGQFSGVQATEWTWSARFMDVDLDGYEDLLVSNGMLHDFEDTDTNDRVQRLSLLGNDDFRQLTLLYPSYLTPNVAFQNKGDLTFENVSQEWGFTEPDIAWGMAFADFDNDGDLDLATNRPNDPAGIYRNESDAARIAVRLKGLTPNTQGIGAKIRVLNGPVSQSKEVISGGTYLSGSDPMFTFAAGSSENKLTIEVVWRSGKISNIKDAVPNRIYEIHESGAIAVEPSQPDSSDILTPFFEDVSTLINHEHHEDVYDDFKRQPLLPFRLSQLGPGVAWHDIDGDHDDDLIITSGKGGRLACFRNNGKQGFSSIRGEVLSNDLKYDQTSVIGWSKENGEISVLVGGSNYEGLQSSNAFVKQYDFTNGSIVNSTTITGDKSSTGPLSLADYDGDGDLDLFIGGRIIPGRFPEFASSKLYRNESSSFKIDEINSKLFKRIGMVSGSVFSDIDNDGDPDLILALQWGPLLIFRNNAGHFADVTSELGFDQYKGWWNGVTTGDLNEDGALDIIATNWGLNTEYPASTENPLRIYYDDFDGNGTMDIIEAHFDPGMNKIVPERGLASFLKAIPYIRSRTPNFQRFAAASVDEIIGKPLSEIPELTTNNLAHMVFLNLGNRFEALPFPKEAQFAPAFYAGIADFDGDGHDDIFISQNFFAMQPGLTRFDAGRGLWLKGDGAGNLEVVPGQISGIKVYGEQRGAALGDYDLDSRVDLVVTQNGAATKLYHNIGAKPGLRVKLQGPKYNPSGIGAIVRIVYEHGFGPAREIHGGSGYLSQDSVVPVMGLRNNPLGVWVRWPGGKVTQVPISGNPSNITITYDN